MGARRHGNMEHEYFNVRSICQYHIPMPHNEGKQDGEYESIIEMEKFLNVS